MADAPSCIAQLAKLGTPAARRLLPTLNRLFDEANSKPGLVPFRLRLSLEGLEKVWDDIGAPQRELEDWLHAVEAFMSEKASTWSPDEVQAIADDLARYSVVLHGGMDTEDFDIRAGQTVRPALARAPEHQQPELQPRRPN